MSCVEALFVLCTWNFSVSKRFLCIVYVEQSYTAF